MKANELMIGDWVFTLESTHKEKVYAQIWAIEEGQTSILVKKDNCNWFVDIEWIEPIPLTAEILEKNGFEKYSLSDSLSQRFEVKEGYTLKVAQFDIRVIKDELTIYGPNNKYSFIPIRCNVLILYVHELQHALKLCGIDKEIVL